MHWILKIILQLAVLPLAVLAMLRFEQHKDDVRACELFLPRAVRSEPMFMVERDSLPTTPGGKVVDVKFTIKGSDIEHNWTCEFTLWPDGKLRIARAFPVIQPSRRN